MLIVNVMNQLRYALSTQHMAKLAGDKNSGMVIHATIVTFAEIQSEDLMINIH